MFPNTVLTRINQIYPRFFSTLVTKVPDEAKKFFLKNQHHLKEYPTEQEISTLANKFVSYISDQSNKGCIESQNLLKNIRQFSSDDKVTAIFVYGSKKIDEKNEIISISLSNVIACIANALSKNTFENSNIIADPLVSEKANVFSRFLLPHVDYPLSDDKFDHNLISLIGVRADKKNYRTYVIESKQIIKNLSDKTKNILQQNIFHHNQYDKNESDCILHQTKNGNFLTKFDCNVEPENYSWNAANSKNNYSDKEIAQAVSELYQVTMDFYKNNKCESFYIGNNDILMIKNYSVFHGRDQYGVKEEDQNHERIARIYSYEQKENSNFVSKLKDQEAKQPNI